MFLWKFLAELSTLQNFILLYILLDNSSFQSNQFSLHFENHIKLVLKIFNLLCYSCFCSNVPIIPDNTAPINVGKNPPHCTSSFLFSFTLRFEQARQRNFLLYLRSRFFVFSSMFTLPFKVFNEISAKVLISSPLQFLRIIFRNLEFSFFKICSRWWFFFKRSGIFAIFQFVK